MARTYRCPSCGAEVEFSILPRSWSATSVKRWRELESKMAGPCCLGVPLPEMRDNGVDDD